MQKPRIPRKSIAFLAVLATGAGTLFGYDIGIVSGALVQLKQTFSLSCHQQEMVVSSMLLGALFGSVLGGYFIDKCGRKPSIVLSSLLYFIGAVVLAVSPSYGVIILGRVLLGLAMALAGAAECVYVSELSPQNVRGTLVSLNELGITVGILLSYLVNYAFASNTETGWRYMFGLSGAGAFVVLGTVLFLPQSPRYLLMKQKKAKAMSALLQVRVNFSEADKSSVMQEFDNMEQNVATKHEVKCTWLICKSVAYPSIIGVGLVILQQSTGEPNVLFYANTILLNMGFEGDVVASLGSVGLGVAKVIATIVCLTLVDKVGRKALLLVGCSLITLSIFGLSLIAFTHDIQGNTICVERNFSSNNYTVEEHSTVVTTSSTLDFNSGPKWVALLLLMLFICAYSIGFGPVTWIVLSEIFPVQFRGRLFALTYALNWAVNLIISSTFLDFVSLSGGLGWPFALCSMFGVIAFVFVWFVVPETKGKSLEEINTLLNNCILLKKCSASCSGCFHSHNNDYGIPLVSPDNSSSLTS